MTRRARRALLGAALVVASLPGAAQAFAPNDPGLARQWYLQADGALQAFENWPAVPVLTPVRVAVIDSGLDCGHPEFQARVALTKSFVGGSPCIDEQGHGTFVAGEIAAAADNGVGIAGIAFPAQLVIAKVVRADGTISLAAEAEAIRWAVDNGARVVNLSIGGVRDPTDAERDTFSALEASAVAYAHAKGAVVVASVGNSDQAPKTPWNYASYPAALPHVIGVSALDKDGSIPTFSDRDAIYNDIAAPGVDIFSTFPRQLTAQYSPSCPDQGYSDCANDEYRNAEGTSFAAPQVSAAAALLLAVRPGLTADQVGYALERSAKDARALTGCAECPLQRDALSGWGALDVAGALSAIDGPLPAADVREPNDDAGSQAAALYGRAGVVHATLDFWDDQIDVYRTFLRKGEWLSAGLLGPSYVDINLVLWRPGTEQVEGFSSRSLDSRITQSAAPGSHEEILYRARATGWYYVEAKVATATPAPARYSLRLTKSG